MRARLALLPSGWEADEEMEGRLRGLLDGGGGEDIMAVYVCMYVCMRVYVGVSCQSRRGERIVMNAWSLAGWARRQLR